MRSRTTNQFRFPQPVSWNFVFQLVCILIWTPILLSGIPNPDGEVVFPIEKIVIDTGSVQGVTEAELINLAIAESRKLQSLNTNVDIAQYRLNSSGWMENPELRIRNLTTRSHAEKFDELEFGLRIRLPELGELAEDRQQARVRLWEEKIDEMRYRQELVRRIRRDISDVLLYDQIAQLTEKKVTLLDERIGRIEQMIHTGDRSIVYFTKAKMIRANAKNEYARSVQNQNSARRKLVKRTNINLDTYIIQDEQPEVTADLDRLIETANRKRPRMTLAAQQIDLALKQKRFETLKVLPWINYLEVSYHREQERGLDWGEFRVGMDLPLFNWNIGNIKAMNLAVKKREARYNAILETIEEEVRSAYNLYMDTLLDWKNFKLDAQTLVMDAQKVVDQAVIHQTLRPDEVMEMELTIIETQQLLIEKERNLAHALYDLYYAVGIENYNELDQ